MFWDQTDRFKLDSKENALGFELGPQSNLSKTCSVKIVDDWVSMKDRTHREPGPGPGSYNPVVLEHVQSLKIRSRSPTRKVEVVNTPGPGSYYTPPRWVSPTFNTRKQTYFKKSPIVEGKGRMVRLKWDELEKNSILTINSARTTREERVHMKSRLREMIRRNRETLFGQETDHFSLQSADDNETDRETLSNQETEHHLLQHADKDEKLLLENEDMESLFDSTSLDNSIITTSMSMESFKKSQEEVATDQEMVRDGFPYFEETTQLDTSQLFRSSPLHTVDVKDTDETNPPLGVTHEQLKPSSPRFSDSTILEIERMLYQALRRASATSIASREGVTASLASRTSGPYRDTSVNALEKIFDLAIRQAAKTYMERTGLVSQGAAEMEKEGEMVSRTSTPFKDMSSLVMKAMFKQAIRRASDARLEIFNTMNSPKDEEGLKLDHHREEELSPYREVSRGAMDSMLQQAILRTAQIRLERTRKDAAETSNNDGALNEQDPPLRERAESPQRKLSITATEATIHEAMRKVIQNFFDKRQREDSRRASSPYLDVGTVAMEQIFQKAIRRASRLVGDHHSATRPVDVGVDSSDNGSPPMASRPHTAVVSKSVMEDILRGALRRASNINLNNLNETLIP